MGPREATDSARLHVPTGDQERGAQAVRLRRRVRQVAVLRHVDDQDVRPLGSRRGVVRVRGAIPTRRAILPRPVDPARVVDLGATGQMRP